MRDDKFTQEEIERVKYFYTQNLCIFISDILAENLMKLGLFLAGNNLQGEQETSRILIRKKMIGGQIKIVAEAEYSNLRCYGLTANGEFDEQAQKRIPGAVKAIYTLDSAGFKLSHIEASNSHLSRLITGNFPENTTIDELATNAAEEEFSNSMVALEQAETSSAGTGLTELIQPEIGTIRQELQRQHYATPKEDVSYVEKMSKLSVVANRVVDAVSMPAHIPTIKRLAETASDKFIEPEPAKPSKLKWALIGIAAVLVIGICIAASIFSFGAAAPPAIITSVVAAGVASQAASIVLGTGAVVTTAVSAKKINEPSTAPSPLKSSLQSIGQKIGLFSSKIRPDTEIEDTKDKVSQKNASY